MMYGAQMMISSGGTGYWILRGAGPFPSEEKSRTDATEGQLTQSYPKEQAHNPSELAIRLCL